MFIPEKQEKMISSGKELITVKLNLGGIQLGASRDTLALGSTKYFVRRQGQFIYGKQNFFNGSMAIIPDECDGMCTSGDVPALGVKNIDPLHLYMFVSREEYWKNKEKEATGTGSKRIHEKTLLGFTITVPRDVEQKCLHDLTQRLTKDITLHQRELELLKNVKKGFLQKLFVDDR